MFFRSRLFWGGVLLCICMGMFFGLLFYRANRMSQEPIKIYKTVMPERRTASQPLDKLTVQTRDTVNETAVIFTPVSSDVSIDSEDFVSTDTQIFDTGLQTEERVASDTTEAPSVSEQEEERFFGLTLAEIEKRIPMLEREIRTNITKAVELYTDLISTDGMAGESPEIAAWRDKTWAEVKRLFYEASRQKIPSYVSYLRVTGGDNPLRSGGWLSQLMEPLPMQVTYGGTSR